MKKILKSLPIGIILLLSCGKNGGNAVSNIEIVDNIEYEDHGQDVVNPETSETIDEIIEETEKEICKEKVKIIKGKKFLFKKKKEKLIKIKIIKKPCKISTK